MNIKEALKEGIQLLKKENIEDSTIIAKLLLSYTLNVKKEYLITHDLEEIGALQKQQYSCYIKEIINGKPLQYITKHQEFMQLDFYVDENVLIPRADTEILVEEVIEICKKERKQTILDVCTGSGAIGISIAKNFKNSKVTLADISEEALQVAEKNMQKNNVENQINLVKSNMFEDIKEKFDIIVSNPPYIETKVIETLNEDVKNQPMIALDGGEDGLEFYRIIIQNAYKYLNQNGYLCLEIGYNQKDSVIELLHQSGKYEGIYYKKDLYGNDRVIIAKVR